MEKDQLEKKARKDEKSAVPIQIKIAEKKVNFIKSLL